MERSAWLAKLKCSLASASMNNGQPYSDLPLSSFHADWECIGQVAGWNPATNSVLSHFYENSRCRKDRKCSFERRSGALSGALDINALNKNSPSDWESKGSRRNENRIISVDCVFAGYFSRGSSLPTR